MTDIVRIWEQYANSKGYVFKHGQSSYLNLLDVQDAWTGELDTVYFLHENREGTNVKGTNFIKGMRYVGKFFLVKHADLDQHYFEVNGKYPNNIEPLIQAFRNIESDFGCTDIIFESFKFIEVTDALDANLDGLLIYYTVTVPDGYTIVNGQSS
jgi:hypothetical protein